MTQSKESLKQERKFNSKLQDRAKELFNERCFQGDLARNDVDSLTGHDIDVLNAISETAFALGHTFECDEVEATQRHAEAKVRGFGARRGA